MVEGKQGTKLEDLARNDFVLWGKTTQAEKFGKFEVTFRDIRGPVVRLALIA